jgi:cell wall-associated NlpC family hydrolase
LCNKAALNNLARSLAGKPVYKKPALREEAPNRADCLTLIHYLFKKAIRMNIPLTYIGDMPRLLSKRGWKVTIIKESEAQSGDLLFVKDKNQSKFLSHVAVFLNPDSLFHCCRKAKTAVEQKSDDFFTNYEQKLTSDESILYIDPRNKIMRRKHGNNKFIKMS